MKNDYSKFFLKEELLKNTKLMVAIIIGVFIFFGLVLIYWEQDELKAERRNLNTAFAGSVNRVEYDIKDFPTVTIGDNSYYIGSLYNADHQIEVGDSIIKKRGSATYILIKHDSHKIIEFKKYSP